VGTDARNAGCAVPLSWPRSHDDRGICCADGAGRAHRGRWHIPGGDEARRVERLAYRVRQLQLAFPGFADGSKTLWEQDPRWHPLRQHAERLLVTYDWGEAFVALNLVLKPMIDDLFLKRASDLTLGDDDHLLGQVLLFARRRLRMAPSMSQALTQTAMEDTPTNRPVIQTWINKWYLGALRAMDAFSSIFEGKPGGPGIPPFHNVTSQILVFSGDYFTRDGSPTRLVEDGQLTPVQSVRGLSPQPG
jgi:methane/phenol/toluene hydroxylase